MKKMLSILASLGVVATSSTAVVACGEETHKVNKNKLGEIVTNSATKPDKNGVIHANIVVRYNVPQFFTEKQAKDAVGLYNKTIDKKNGPSVTKVTGLTNYKVDFNDPFYQQNLNKKGNKKFCRVEMKITWDVQAKEKISSASYTVAYQYANSDVAIDLGDVSFEYKAHNYQKADNNKQEQKPQ